MVRILVHLVFLRNSNIIQGTNLRKKVQDVDKKEYPEKLRELHNHNKNKEGINDKKE